jgi:hypothetical protein
MGIVGVQKDGARSQMELDIDPIAERRTAWKTKGAMPSGFHRWRLILFLQLEAGRQTGSMA